MNKVLITAVVYALASLAPVGAQTSATGAGNYRAQANVQLRLTFQGIAEGGISRSLRFFGSTGSCEAWYEISEVIAAPATLNIKSGERLKLSYECGEKRVYVSEAGESQPWAQDTGTDVHAWLRSTDIKAGRAGTWKVDNPENRFAPVAVQSPK